MNLPEASVVQPVRAQMRPEIQGAGAVRVKVALEANSKPVDDSCGLPSPVNVPGQTVYGQLFVNVSVAASAPAFERDGEQLC